MKGQQVAGPEAGRRLACSRNRGPNDWRVVGEKESGKEEIGTAGGNQITWDLLYHIKELELDSKRGRR